MKHEPIPVIEITTSGGVSLPDMIRRMETRLNDPETPRVLYLLEDARLAKVSFSYEELDILVEKFTQFLPSFEKIRHAVVQSTPINTAFTVAIRQRINSPIYVMEVFSTLSAARKWLKTV